MRLGAFPSSFPLSSRISAHLSSLPRITSICLFSPHLKDFELQTFGTSYHSTHFHLPSSTPSSFPSLLSFPNPPLPLAYGFFISHTKWYVLNFMSRHKGTPLFERKRQYYPTLDLHLVKRLKSSPGGQPRGVHFKGRASANISTFPAK